MIQLTYKETLFNMQSYTMKNLNMQLSVVKNKYLFLKRIKHNIYLMNT